MKNFILVCLGVALLLSQTARAAPVAVIDGSGLYTGINDLDVNGTLYNVVFREGTQGSVFAGTFDFTTEADAAWASTAIYSALPAYFGALDASPSLMYGCDTDLLACYIMTPYAIDGSGNTQAVSMRNGMESQSVQNGNNSGSFNASFNTTGFIDYLGGGYVWADWSPSNVVVSPVPEPETYAMLLVGLGLIGFMARRRREDFSF